MRETRETRGTAGNHINEMAKENASYGGYKNAKDTTIGHTAISSIPNSADIEISKQSRQTSSKPTEGKRQGLPYYQATVPKDKIDHFDQKKDKERITQLLYPEVVVKRDSEANTGDKKGSNLKEWVRLGSDIGKLKDMINKSMKGKGNALNNSVANVHNGSSNQLDPKNRINGEEKERDSGSNNEANPDQALPERSSDVNLGEKGGDTNEPNEVSGDIDSYKNNVAAKDKEELPGTTDEEGYKNNDAKKDKEGLQGTTDEERYKNNDDAKNKEGLPDIIDEEGYTNSDAAKDKEGLPGTTDEGDKVESKGNSGVNPDSSKDREGVDKKEEGNDKEQNRNKSKAGDADDNQINEIKEGTENEEKKNGDAQADNINANMNGNGDPLEAENECLGEPVAEEEVAIVEHARRRPGRDDDDSSSEGEDNNKDGKKGDVGAPDEANNEKRAVNSVEDVEGSADKNPQSNKEGSKKKSGVSIKKIEKSGSSSKNKKTNKGGKDNKKGKKTVDSKIANKVNGKTLEVTPSKNVKGIKVSNKKGTAKSKIKEEGQGQDSKLNGSSQSKKGTNKIGSSKSNSNSKGLNFDLESSISKNGSFGININPSANRSNEKIKIDDRLKSKSKSHSKSKSKSDSKSNSSSNLKGKANKGSTTSSAEKVIVIFRKTVGSPGKKMKSDTFLSDGKSSSFTKTFSNFGSVKLSHEQLEASVRLAHKNEAIECKHCIRCCTSFGSKL